MTISKSQIRSKANCLGFWISVIVICLVSVFCYLKIFSCWNLTFLTTCCQIKPDKDLRYPIHPAWKTVTEAGARQYSTPVSDLLKFICLPAKVVKSEFFCAWFLMIWILSFRIQISGYFKIFDYWTNLSYPFYFYFVTLSEQNILSEFQKVVIFIKKMRWSRNIYNEH